MACVCIVGNKEEEGNQRGDSAEQQTEGDDAESAGERVWNPQKTAGGETSNHHYQTRDYQK